MRKDIAQIKSTEPGERFIFADPYEEMVQLGLMT